MTKRYKGELGKPIATKQPPKPPGLLTGKSKAEAEAEYAEERRQYLHSTTMRCSTEAVEKLILLFDYYNIPQKDSEGRWDDDRWFRLALALAMDHVPGFRTEPEGLSGRPRKRDQDPYFFWRLYLDVEALKRERESKGQRVAVTEICNTLIKREEYKAHKKGKSLANLYYKASEDVLVRVYLRLVEGIPKERIPEEASYLRELLAKKETP